MKRRKGNTDWRIPMQHVYDGPVKKCSFRQGSCAILSGPVKHSGGKPASAKTYADLLEKDDRAPGVLSSEQRSRYEEKAGGKYKKQDPFTKHRDESIESYVRRVNKLTNK